jgi:hypothetical protein
MRIAPKLIAAGMPEKSSIKKPQNSSVADSPRQIRQPALFYRER